MRGNSYWSWSRARCFCGFPVLSPLLGLPGRAIQEIAAQQLRSSSRSRYWVAFERCLLIDRRTRYMHIRLLDLSGGPWVVSWERLRNRGVAHQPQMWLILRPGSTGEGAAPHCQLSPLMTRLERGRTALLPWSMGSSIARPHRGGMLPFCHPSEDARGEVKAVRGALLRRAAALASCSTGG